MKEQKRFRWSGFSYTTRLTVMFALIAAMTALVAMGVVSFVWEEHFRTYTTENMNTLAETTARRIGQSYAKTESLDDPATMSPAIQASEMTSGVAVRVVDAQNQTVYDSSAVVEEVLGGRRWYQSLEPLDPSRVATAPIISEGKTVGCTARRR